MRGLTAPGRRNHDLHIASVAASSKATGAGGKGAAADTAPQLIKISSMVDCALWHDSTDMLVAIADSKVVVWYYPNVVSFQP